MRVFLLLILALLAPGFSQASSMIFKPIDVKPIFLDESHAFTFTWSRTDSGNIRLHWQIAPGYYLYRDKFSFAGLDHAMRPALPKGEVHVDDFFGRVEIYRESLELTLPPDARGTLHLGWQGCAEAGLCYPPAGADLNLGEVAEAAAQQQSPAALLAEDQSLAGTLAQQNLALSLAMFFGLGLLLAFTPCSLPMLPILATVIAGGHAGRGRGIVLAAVYVLSMSAMYAALGLAAASLGANLQVWLQQPWLLMTFAGIFVVLAMPMFGLFELQLPGLVRDRLQVLGSTQRGGSLVGAAMLGILSGLLIGPCMTAPLAGALLYIAQGGDMVGGGLALFALGLGTGTPLLAVTCAGSRFLPKPGAWMDRVKRFVGLMLLAAALLVVRPLAEGPLWVVICAFMVISMALALIYSSSAHARTMRIVGAAALMWGGIMAGGALAGATDPLHPLQPFLPDRLVDTSEHFTIVRTPDSLQRELDAATAADEWVLIDYYADWCVACKVMDRKVFSQPEALERLQNVRLLKVDISKGDPASRSLLDRFEVLGPPTQVWVDPHGEERRSARITGEVDRAAFLQRADQVLGRE